MADLIDRAALIEKIDKKFFATCPAGEEQLGYLNSRNLVRTAPAVDAVEVVRCCKCKHYNLQLTGARTEIMCCTINAEYDEDVGVWYGFTSYPPPEFYCADGERRTDATN